MSTAQTSVQPPHCNQWWPFHDQQASGRDRATGQESRRRRITRVLLSHRSAYCGLLCFRLRLCRALTPPALRLSASRAPVPTLLVLSKDVDGRGYRCAFPPVSEAASGLINRIVGRTRLVRRITRTHISVESSYFYLLCSAYSRLEVFLHPPIRHQPAKRITENHRPATPVLAISDYRLVNCIFRRASS